MRMMLAVNGCKGKKGAVVNIIHYQFSPIGINTLKGVHVLYNSKLIKLRTQNFEILIFILANIEGKQ